MKDKAFIHLFKTPGGYYFYDVNRNSILKTEKSVWYRLRDVDCNLEILNQDDRYNEEDKVIKKIIEYGFLSSGKVKKIIHSIDGIINDYIKKKISLLNLQITQKCNLRCDYCVYSGNYENRMHTNKSMDYGTAKKSIDFLIKNSIDEDRISLGFYGGEPLIEYELIKKCIEYANIKSEGKDILYTITTNATLLNKEMIEFFYKYDVNILISLDGPKQIHDENRKFAHSNKGTHEKVIENIIMIKENYPDFFENIKYNAVVDQKNDINVIFDYFNSFEIHDNSWVRYSELVEYYCKKDLCKNITYYKAVNYEYFKLLLSKLGRLDEEHVSKLINDRFTDLQRMYKQLKTTKRIPEKMHHGGPCVPGAQRLFVNVDGDFFPCERVSETSEIMKIGNIDEGMDIEKIRNLLNVGSISENKCKNCWAIRFCTLCAAAADDGSELSKNQKLKWCDTVTMSAEEKLKDICFLREQNFRFSESMGV